MKIEQNNRVITRTIGKGVSIPQDQMPNFSDSLLAAQLVESKKEIIEIRSSNINGLQFNLAGESIQKGEQLLEGLRSIQVALLQNSVSKDHLQELKKLEEVLIEIPLYSDLKNILEEIELRAAVEIAKLEKEWN